MGGRRAGLSVHQLDITEQNVPKAKKNQCTRSLINSLCWSFTWKNNLMITAGTSSIFAVWFSYGEKNPNLLLSHRSPEAKAFACEQWLNKSQSQCFGCILRKCWLPASKKPNLLLRVLFAMLISTFHFLCVPKRSNAESAHSSGWDLLCWECLWLTSRYYSSGSMLQYFYSMLSLGSYPSTW